jgi:hypothetical protein
MPNAQGNPKKHLAMFSPPKPRWMQCQNANKNYPLTQRIDGGLVCEYFVGVRFFGAAASRLRASLIWRLHPETPPLHMGTTTRAAASQASTSEAAKRIVRAFSL